MFRLLPASLVLVLACGSSSTTSTTPKDPGAKPTDGLTEVQRHQYAACDALAPTITACAMADAKATMSEEELAKLELDKVAPEHTRKFAAACKEPKLTSYQVRVYEVCQREETECEALLACLDHVNDPPPQP